jgi:4-amino-4-deoxy-L-arabinose transferase-like glycosyltransferase
VALAQLLERQTTTAPNVKVAAIHAPTNLLGWIPLLWTQLLFPGAPPAREPWRWPPFLTITLLSAALLYPCLSFHLFEPDEGRYAQLPREMLERGEWIVPTLQGEAYLDKPPLFYWLVMASYTLFGFHDWAARLVPALAMHASVLLCYVLGRRMLGARSAFWGTLLLSVSPIFLGVGRLLVLDGLLTLWITLAALSIYLATCESKTRLRTAWWLTAAIATGLGVLTKGPVALLLVLPPMLAQRWLMLESARISWRAWAGFLAIVLAINLPWYVAVCVRQPEFARYFLWQHNVQRFVEPFDHVRPMWFYLPILLYGLLPVTLLAWPLVRFLLTTDEISRQRCQAMGYLLIAGVWCVGFFSLAGCKLPTYIMPAFPPFCLALGCFLARTEWHRSRWVIRLIAFGWFVQACATVYLVPAYAEYRSPMSEHDFMRERCGDSAVPVVCFPRNVDSVAFYVGRSDFQTFRSKDVDLVIQELEKHPRTVVLFGHRNSPETLALRLPANLRMIERRPMGLCESAIIERMR